MIGERLRAIRESTNLSQGDIERRTGMLCYYTSRVENGHTLTQLGGAAGAANAELIDEVLSLAGDPG
jgi:transcriptional regulator with XRE-family HTH domain